MKARTLLVGSCGLAALALAVPCGVLGWREWRERTLLGDLDSPEPATRKAAALELGRLKCARAIPKLVRLLEMETRPIFNEPFLTYPHPRYDPEQHIALVGHGTDLMEVHHAARSLREIGLRAVRALAEALESAEEPWVQLQIIHVLRCLGPDAQAAVPALARALDSSNVWVLINASVTLGLLRERAAEALPALEALVKRQPMDGPLNSLFEDAIGLVSPRAKLSPP